MRYSDEKNTRPIRVAARHSNEAFFAHVAKLCDPELARGAILLVGARDQRARAVRHAQAILRYDQRASYFSHAALIVRWDAKRLGQSIGLEVAIDSDHPDQQVPERNGVTCFQLSRYFDEARYPNLAFLAMSLKAVPRFDPDTSPDGSEKDAQTLHEVERKHLLVDAARNPNRQREAYPLWESLAAWSRYTLIPEVADNPLQSNIPHPGAALCEYAYAAGGVDVVPGATTNHTCPELLWATMGHWRETLAATASKVRTYCVVRDEYCTPPDPLSMEIDL